MKKIVQQNIAFLLPYLLFLIVAGAFLYIFPKGEAHLMINQCRYELCDHFFYLATYLGDGIAAAILTASLLFVRYRYAFFVGISNIIASAITQTLKHTIFADQVRPAKYFEGVAELKLIPWVENYFYNSFPSGHTTTAFTTLFCLSLLTENKLLKFLFFVTALLIGFSRVYLSQHFLSDVYAGSLIGVFVAMFIYLFIIQSERVRKNSWLDGSLLNIKKK